MNLNRLTPVEKANKRRRLIRFWIVVALLAAALYYLIFVNTYVVAYEDEREHFKYGSIGSEIASGLPYWVFKALPVLYKDELGPQGFKRFGLLYESDDADLPIGVSRRIVGGTELVWLNCAVCHVGTYRETANGEPALLYGAPSNNLRLYEFIQFLRHVAVDSKFNADNLLAAINSDEVGGDLGFLKKALYRYLIIDRVRDGLLQVRERTAFLDKQLDWGPGRVDTFNPYKAIQFRFPMDPNHINETELNGASDYPSIWRQGPREGMQLHWDGNNTSVAERNLSAALGAGVTPVTVDRDSIQRLEKWIWTFPAPGFPKEEAIDRDLAGKGRKLYAYYCADCHGMGKDDGDYDYDTRRYRRLGTVTALADIATDEGRWASYTQNFAAAQNLLYAGYPWRFHQFRKTGGYANHPLDGIWARSPYLHNGSVPTLRDLMEPSAERPPQWYRGSDLFDFDKVGYRSDGAAASKDSLFLFDTTKPGNANRGHEGAAYGTELAPAAKDAIVEYMKTL